MKFKQGLGCSFMMVSEEIHEGYLDHLRFHTEIVK
jgi:hypothetical protein